jgi:hypothetical protein
MKRRFRACRRYNSVVATGTLTYARHTHPQNTTYRYEKKRASSVPIDFGTLRKLPELPSVPPP